MNRIVILLIFFLGSWQGMSQITNNYYYADNSSAIIDTLENIAIVPAWVVLQPDVYSEAPEKLKNAEEEASLFFQDLLYSSLLLTNASQLTDIYRINSLLVNPSKEIPRPGLHFSPVELCEILNADAVLLTFASHDKLFVVNNLDFTGLFKKVEWNRPLKRKNIVMGLFYKDGTPLWAAAFDTGGIKSTVREENQQFPITLYGYFDAKRLRP